jgi:hypothetical protein
MTTTHLNMGSNNKMASNNKSCSTLLYECDVQVKHGGPQCILQHLYHAATATALSLVLYITVACIASWYVDV